MMWTPQKTINNKFGRIVALIDMDCFYCQVEEQLNPALKGKPIIVQPLQYDDYGGGGIIALNYVAKARGVKRSMRGDEAKKVCSDLELVRVPVVRGKADLSKYRNAGKDVAAVLQTFTPLMTRASVDEAYLDLTGSVNNRLADMNKGKYSLQQEALNGTHVVGYSDIAEFVQYVTNKVTKVIDNDDDDMDFVTEDDLDDVRKNDLKLLIASTIVNEIRAMVKEKTGYECSAGVAHNRVLAKLVSGMNKPNKQTLLPIKQIAGFYRTLPIKKVQGLGGKLGEKICTELNVEHMAELLAFSKEELQKRYDEKNGQWLYNLARGIDLDNIVTPRLIPKSISCSKMFPRHNAIGDVSTLEHWMHEIIKDVVERIQQDELENNRRAKQMVVSFTQTIKNADISSSRAMNIAVIDEEKIVNDAINVIKKNTAKFLKSDDSKSLNNPIKFLGFNVCKFDSLDKRSSTIGDLFAKGQKKAVAAAQVNENSTLENECDANAKDQIALDNDNCGSSSSFLSKYHVEVRVEDGDSFEDDSSDDENDITSATMRINRTDQIKLDHSADSENQSTSSNKDYMQTYAEFYVEKVECKQCGKMIAASDIQVHTDAHLAFQIIEEQREEFRNQLKRPHLSKTPIKKKQKSSATNKTETSLIQKYLVKRQDTCPQPSTSSAVAAAATAVAVEMEKCSECSKNIPIVELFEHMDFHAAKRLHDELMKTDIKAMRTNDTSTGKKSAGSNKRSLTKMKKSDKANVKNTAVRNITAFFQTSAD